LSANKSFSAFLISAAHLLVPFSVEREKQVRGKKSKEFLCKKKIERE